MPVAEEVSVLERKIIRQVEHYFGDENLPKDKFLQEAIKEDEGWISMSTMLDFKRLADLSKDAKQILGALAKSESGLMQINEDGDGKIRRSPEHPLPENNEETKKKREARTAYVKGFDKEKTTMDELLDYYAVADPSVVNIAMRSFRNPDKTRGFKGSVFLTFRTLEDCKKFIEAETHKYKDKDLEKVMYQNDYQEFKQKEYEEKRGKNKGKKDKKEDNKPEKEAEPEKDKTGDLPRGAILKITGLGGEITREDIKDKLAKEFEVNIDKTEGDVAFVTYQKGEEEAKIRFKKENYAKELLEKIQKAEKFVIMEKEAVASVLEGDEETSFLENSLKEMKSMMNNKKNHKRKGGPARGGGHGGKRGRR